MFVSNLSRGTYILLRFLSVTKHRNGGRRTQIFYHILAAFWYKTGKILSKKNTFYEKPYQKGPFLNFPPIRVLIFRHSIFPSYKTAKCKNLKQLLSPIKAQNKRSASQAALRFPLPPRYGTGLPFFPCCAKKVEPAARRRQPRRSPAVSRKASFSYGLPVISYTAFV